MAHSHQSAQRWSDSAKKLADIAKKESKAKKKKSGPEKPSLFSMMTEMHQYWKDHSGK